ncbi:DUF1624 domain-containing protein [Frateuria defendens]|uniref:DUF1624 domain-containing protein n=1 Tax=Frateuria defendens TaxID=2219559 RepID=UPI00066FEF3D|nr:heparan-alpha-glucosaminide N-acetyltransferase domain-containing protein [Frateuria defendens]
MSTLAVPAAQAPSATAAAAAVHYKRITSIDLLRGLVMIIMLMDHVRETIYLQHQVSDPMDVASTPPAVFFSRLAAHFCAPAFVFLTGLGAWLYGHPPSGTPRPVQGFLIKRGLLLLALEVSVISFLWTGSIPPKVIYLQVMWAIGLSMIVLAFAARLPRAWLAGIGLVLVAGHNALAGIDLSPDNPLYVPWTLLLHRGWVYQGDLLQIRLTYPVVPWIGVILLGWVAGPLYSSLWDSTRRRALLTVLGLACWTLLVVLRGFNLYGENAPWVVGVDATHTLMSFLDFTKYPPSLDFLLMTLGTAMLVLAWLDQADNAFTRVVSTLGGAPMFYYLLHLSVLIGGYKILLTVFGPNQGTRFGVDTEHFWVVWVVTVGLAALLYWPCRAFARYKRRTKLAWVKYF